MLSGVLFFLNHLFVHTIIKGGCGRQPALSDEHDGDKGITEVTAAAHTRPAKTFTVRKPV